jgi:dCMP deaminase
MAANYPRAKPAGPKTHMEPQVFTAEGRADWDARFMGLARHIAEWSKDRSRRVGCVIVGPDCVIRATGYNGFPRGLDDEPAWRHDRPAKYQWTEHAERNAIYNAARLGVSLSGCNMYLPWFPCVECARAIVQVGIHELICEPYDAADPVWGTAFETAAAILREGNVSMRYYPRFKT